MASKFKKGQKVKFSDGFCRKYEGKIKQVYYDQSINQYHYSFEEIKPIDHNPKYDFVPKTNESESLVEAKEREL